MRRKDTTIRRQHFIAVALFCAVAFTTSFAQTSDPLPSWNDGAARKSIIEFVTKVTKPGSPDFVPVAERIATFDNDGTLWCGRVAFEAWIGMPGCRSETHRRRRPVAG